MRRVWLGLACGIALLAAPVASAQDLNTALQAFNCGTPTPPPTAPRSQHPNQHDLETFAQQATAWQTAEQAIGHCIFAAQSAMDQRITARVTEYNQHLNQGRQAVSAWQAASGAPAAASH